MRVPLVLTLGLCAILAAGCMGRAGTLASPALYDLASAQPIQTQATAVPLRSIEVRAPSWIASTAMQYRLAYANEQERSSYAAARWAAAPAELVEQILKRHLDADAARGTGCRLQIAVDEFIQVFDAPNTSRAVLEARATLLSPRGDIPLVSHGFRLAPPGGGDAKTGAAAFAGAAAELAGQISIWLKEVAAMPAVASSCAFGSGAAVDKRG